MRRTSLNSLACLAVILMLGNAGQVIGQQVNAQSPAAEAGHKNWQLHQGYWMYWHEPDQRWYYSDQGQWYTYTDNRWTPYRLDSGFRGNVQQPQATVAPQPVEPRRFEVRPRFRVNQSDYPNNPPWRRGAMTPPSPQFTPCANRWTVDVNRMAA